MTTQHDPWVECLYVAMKDADDAFHAAVIRQFGRKQAGTMRYVGSKHNAETKAAAEKYWQSANSYIEARRSADETRFQWYLKLRDACVLALIYPDPVSNLYEPEAQMLGYAVAHIDATNEWAKARAGEMAV